MAKNRISPTPVRMNPETRAKVERLAKKERRSINAWLLIAIDEKLERIERGEAA